MIPLDEEAFVSRRKEFFQTYRAETQKWEGCGSIPDAFLDATGRSPLRAVALAAETLYPERKDSWRQQLSPKSGGETVAAACADIVEDCKPSAKHTHLDSAQEKQM